MSQFMKTYFIALVIFLIIDAFWLGFFAKNFYQREIGNLLLPTPKWGAAALFYLLYLGGLTYLIILPLIETQNLSQGLLQALVFGFMTYATYDLTNLATLEGWSLKVTLIDLLWGSFLGTTVTYISYQISKLF